MSNLYKVLGVRPGASAIQIKSAFRKRAKASHPDLHAADPSAAERFTAISLAYETLGDSVARAAYDAACAEERARARRDLRSAAMTMCATFLLTLSSGLLVAAWMRLEGLL